MHADNLIINDCSTRQAIKRIAKLFPNFDTVTTTTLIVKAIYTVYSRTFVVPTETEEVFWILDFISKEETNNFQGLFSTIYIISEK